MAEAAVSNEEFTAFWNNVLVDKFERFLNILLDGLSYPARLRSGRSTSPKAPARSTSVAAGGTALELARKVGPSGFVLA
jgi:hypothetical protein